MTLDEVAIRAALNVLRDSVESRRMPSGEPLNDGAVQLHAQAIDSLARLLEIVQADVPTLGSAPASSGGPR